MHLTLDGITPLSLPQPYADPTCQSVEPAGCKSQSMERPESPNEVLQRGGRKMLLPPGLGCPALVSPGLARETKPMPVSLSRVSFLGVSSERMWY